MANGDGRWWRPRFDPQKIHPAMRPVFALTLGNLDRLALRTDLVLAERSTIDVDHVDQMCTEPAAQSARSSVSWPAAHRIPAARRWLICTLGAFAGRRVR